ncbi:MAG: ion transporter [Phycisphaerales bacterium]|nr:MAG: ion transporter [Phycisphaerales bacterium]
MPKGTILPPPLPGVRHVRLPLAGIVIADDELRDRMERRFHWPMIILALLVLPLIGMEFFLLPKLPAAQKDLAQTFIVITEITISFAFLIEFVVKITVAESRLEYIRRNWLDIVVICLPLLRALRVLRVARVAQTSRTFRLRGVGMKFARHILTMLLGLNITDRLLERFGVKLHRGRKDPTAMTRHQLMDEVKLLRKRVDAWESWHEAQEQFTEKHGGPGFHAPKPTPPDEPDAECSINGATDSATQA